MKITIIVSIFVITLITIISGAYDEYYYDEPGPPMYYPHRRQRLGREPPYRPRRYRGGIENYEAEGCIIMNGEPACPPGYTGPV